MQHPGPDRYGRLVGLLELRHRLHPAHDGTHRPGPLPYSGVVDLSWDNPANDLVTGWKVTSTPASTEHYVHRFGVVGSTVELAITGIPQGVPYTFTVTPYREYDVTTPQWGPGANFSPITVGRTPGAPTLTDLQVDVTDTGTAVLDLTWLPPAIFSKNIIEYRVVLWRAEHEPIVHTYDATARSAHIELPFFGGAEFDSVSVSARNDNGWGPASGWPTSVMLVARPDAPLALWVDVQPWESAYRAWGQWRRPVSLADAYSPPRFDVVVEGPTPSSTEVVLGGVDDSAQYVPTGLAPGWYQMKVRTKGQYNVSTWTSRWFAVGTPCNHPFTDVPDGHAFCTPISWLVRQGVGNGYPDGTFRPTGAVSRQAMAAFVYRAAGSPNGPTPTCTAAAFPDVPANHPFCGQIKWMVDNGITSGFYDGTFRPTADVSRQAAASFLYKARWENRTDPQPLPACDPGDSPFSDVPDGHAFCPAIKVMSDLRVIGGYPDGTFRPTAPVSRQAIASFLYRWPP